MNYQHSHSELSSLLYYDLKQFIKIRRLLVQFGSFCSKNVCLKQTDCLLAMYSLILYASPFLCLRFSFIFCILIIFVTESQELCAPLDQSEGVTAPLCKTQLFTYYSLSLPLPQKIILIGAQFVKSKGKEKTALQIE